METPTQPGPVPAVPADRPTTAPMAKTNRRAIVPSVPTLRLRRKQVALALFSSPVPSTTRSHPVRGPGTPIMVKSTRKRLHLRSGNQPGAGRPGANDPPWEGAERAEQPVGGKAKRRETEPFSSVPAPRPFRHAVFASEAEYDQSVASVVARIRGGQVKARTDYADVHDDKKKGG